MLDSLVRVSRRVGWRTDRFATDPRRRGQTGPYNQIAVTALCEAVRPRSNYPGRPEAQRRGKRPRSRNVSTSAACNTLPLAGLSYLATGLLTTAEPVVALDIGESAPS